MKKIIISILFLFSLSMADSLLLVKKGWQLIGSSVPLSNMSKFTKDKVEQVWHFDAKTQKWLGYSPDASIQKRMTQKKVGKLTQLKSWHGFWIKSKKEWTMVFEDKVLESEPSNKKSADVIELKKGWNLISLPVNTVVSADIFEGMTAWKYNNNQWELSDPTQETSNFPELGHIKNSDGIWVNAQKDTKISIAKEASKLHTFKNLASLETAIKEIASLNQRPICGIEPVMNIGENAELAVADSTPDTPRNTTNTSDTNVQEKGVDESDILKHNEKYVFYVGKSKGVRNYINISSFEELAKESNKTLGKISFSENYEIHSFYLNNNRLTVLSSYSQEVKVTPDMLVLSNTTDSVVTMFDVSDIKNIKKVSQYTLNGSLKNSRVINDTLYLITRFNPSYKIEYPKEYFTPSSTCQEYASGNVQNENTQRQNIYVECYAINKDEEGYFRYNYDKPNITITQLLPNIEGSNLEKQNLVTPKRLYTSSKKKQSTTMSSISQFSLTRGTYINTTSFMGNSSLEYASSKSFYLVSNEYPYYYDFNNYKSRSSIYKFNFDEELSYKAVGFVYGIALNQFSLSEYNNILRIATTEGFSWGERGTTNALYTLKENNALLEIEGVLSGLGKADETIKSVRFMGDKAYLVTFKNTDPLYTIDLSNPKSPKKMGELQVNGYSAYLHPIGDNKLLGIGQDANSEGRINGVKIELFDISDSQTPTSLDSIMLGKKTYSELEENHKAFAYRSSDHLFAFPFSSSGTVTNNFHTSNYLGIYQVNDNSLKVYKALQSNSKDWGEHRGLIFDLNSKTYVSFFSNDTVITTKLTPKEK